MFSPGTENKYIKYFIQLKYIILCDLNTDTWVDVLKMLAGDHKFGSFN